MNLITALAAACLLGALFVALALLFRDRGDRRMQERLAQVASIEVDDGSRRGPAVVIRRADTNSGIFGGVGRQFFGYNPDNAASNVIAPHFVLVLGGVAGLFTFWLTTKMLDGTLAILAGVLGGLFAIRALFRWQAKRYARKLQRQLPDMIEMLISGARAGLPVTEAMRNVAREMQSPTKEAMAEVVRDVAIGRSMDDALLRLYERTGVSEYSIVAVAIGVQQQTGGALAESLGNVADIVRTRMTIEARAQALASEAKASAVILTALPFVAGGALAIVRPGYLDALFVDERGVRTAAIGVALLIAGILTMRWMIKNAVQD